ncbi:PorP/SprF family type IX secretion system membrane protein [Gaetbulibacter aquiaggeris]|uniref:PorP/SprF family type IX secretion system membrane protein n=1 Tax=Gaetbulibacter aquiaggeris TaxID=1735373 RepID=A0ABW7MUI1_9FLAO
MKRYLLYIVLFFTFMQQFYAQEDGVVAFAIPVRNSLKFNKYIINPTFSFVREQNKYMSFTNKREWVEFENAPQTYLFSYSGRFRENVGAGVGLFQQNYGVLTTFGGVLNFAYNAVLDREQNLTFGMNLAFYKSGLNEGSVITNFSDDPSLNDIPSNSVLAINPGINYGTAFFDFGLSLNNLVSYNIKTNQMIEDNPEQSIQAHIMYTGYLNGRGFFDESKFSGLIRSEFKKEKTVISGIMMLTLPKGVWAQAGYNTLYGASGGIGFNLTNQICLEYNYEKAIGDLASFGNSHEITLAYKFKNNNRYLYSGDDEEGALITPTTKSKRPVANKKDSTKSDEEFRANRKAKAELAAAEKAKAEEEAKIKPEKEVQEKVDEDAIAALAAEEKAKADEIEKIRLAEEAQAKADEEARIKLAAAEAQAKADEEEARMKLAEAEAQAKADEEARMKLAAAEAQAKADEEARMKLAAAEAQAKADEEARIKLAEAEALANEKVVDTTDSAIEDIKASTKEYERIQQLLSKLKETVASKEKDLKDLKQENDLSEQGIYVEPKPFKSVSEENAAIESLKTELENVISDQNEKIVQLENLYSERLQSIPNMNDSINVFYKKTIQDLKTEQSQVVSSKEELLTTLEDIQVKTEIERKRRIKRATYDNEQDRYLKDQATLNIIKQNTPLSTVPLKQEDFDFGEEQSNVQIIKGVSNVESGYYLVLAVHTDIAKRDEFLTKAVSAGQKDINFFYDVSSGKYFIYYEKYDDISGATRALETKGTKVYNSKMSMVKIEN